MTDVHFWILFIYISLTFLRWELRWRDIRNHEDSYDTTYYCDKETYDQITGKIPFRLDDNGTLGTAVDSHGQTYYIVLASKRKLDEAAKAFAEIEKE